MTIGRLKRAMGMCVSGWGMTVTKGCLLPFIRLLAAS